LNFPQKKDFYYGFRKLDPVSLDGVQEFLASTDFKMHVKDRGTNSGSRT